MLLPNLLAAIPPLLPQLFFILQRALLWDKMVLSSSSSSSSVPGEGEKQPADKGAAVTTATTSNTTSPAPKIADASGTQDPKPTSLVGTITTTTTTAIKVDAIGEKGSDASMQDAAASAEEKSRGGGAGSVPQEKESDNLSSGDVLRLSSDDIQGMAYYIHTPLLQNMFNDCN